jgi:hypothetical protein
MSPIESLEAQAEWKSLFDGKSLGRWESTQFGGEGRVYVRDGRIILEMGDSMTGITWRGEELPRTDYEIRLEAMKLDGNDFFCGLTFPVRDSYCSLIVGGWGGGTVGLSSLDGKDASQNETSRIMNFADDRWYQIRVRVVSERIQAWIDDERIVDATIVGRRVSTRPEVDLSKPLGIATWVTMAAVRNIELRRVP